MKTNVGFLRIFLC